MSCTFSHDYFHVQIYAIANLLLMPFVAVTRVAYFCFENTGLCTAFSIVRAKRVLSDRWRSQSGSLGLRQWTPFARWLLRDYNEVNHIFEERCVLLHTIRV